MVARATEVVAESYYILLPSCGDECWIFREEHPSVYDMLLSVHKDYERLKLRARTERREQGHHRDKGLERSAGASTRKNRFSSSRYPHFPSINSLPIVLRLMRVQAERWDHVT